VISLVVWELKGRREGGDFLPSADVKPGVICFSVFTFQIIFVDVFGGIVVFDEAVTIVFVISPKRDRISSSIHPPACAVAAFFAIKREVTVTATPSSRTFLSRQNAPPVARTVISYTHEAVSSFLVEDQLFARADAFESVVLSGAQASCELPYTVPLVIPTVFVLSADNSPDAKLCHVDEVCVLKPQGVFAEGAFCALVCVGGD